MGCHQSKSTETSRALGKRSTTEDVVGLLGSDLAKGKTVVITGANTGLGLETARCLAAHGASVIVCSRNAQNGEKAVASILEKHPEAIVSSAQLDLGSHDSIRKFASSYIASGKPIHILINNAGVMACPRKLTSDGLEQQMGVNHVGHFLLTTLLLPILEKFGTTNQPSRVINVSSLGNCLFAPLDVGVRLDDFNAEKNYNEWIRYGESKLANILFTRELTRRMTAEGKNIIAVSLHPGAIMETELKRHFNFTNQVDMVSKIIFNSRVRKLVFNMYYKNTVQGAATSVFTALSPDIIPSEHYADCGLHTLSPEGACHPLAADVELAKRLWQKTEEVIAQIHQK